MHESHSESTLRDGHEKWPGGRSTRLLVCSLWPCHIERDQRPLQTASQVHKVDMGRGAYEQMRLA